MKINFLTFLALIALPFIGSAQKEFSDPLEYYKHFNLEHAKVSNKNMEYIQTSVHSDDLMAIEQKRLELVKLIKGSIEEVKALPDYEGDTAMRSESVAVLESYLNSFEIEFEQVNSLKQDSRESYEAMEAYFQTLKAGEKKIEEASKRFSAAQKAFAKAHEIILVDAPENSQITDLNRLNAYHRKIFLEEFRVSKKNSEFMDAVDKRDAEAMELYRRQLIVEAQKTLKVLKLLPGFKEDTQYRDSAVKLVELYQNLGENGYKELVGIVGKENLNNQDVDTFNKVIDVYNQQIPQLSGAFQNAGNTLLRKYVPKPIPTKQI